MCACVCVLRVRHPIETKAYGNHGEESFLGRLEGLRYLGHTLYDSAQDHIWGWGGHQGCELEGSRSRTNAFLSLLEITNKPTHQRRIIKNNLHKLSVV